MPFHVMIKVVFEKGLQNQKYSTLEKSQDRNKKGKFLPKTKYNLCSTKD